MKKKIEKKKANTTNTFINRKKRKEEEEEEEGEEGEEGEEKKQKYISREGQTLLTKNTALSKR